MMIKLIAAGVTVALALSSCTTEQQTGPTPPLKLPTELGSQTAPTPPTTAQLLAQQPSQIQEAVKEHQQDGKWIVFRTPERALYPYNQEPEPTVSCAPLRTTDIQLQQGETITDVALGDSERWMATPAASGDPRNPVPHLALKPQAPGIETNLTIYTTRHIYHLLLHSRVGHAMQEVEFYYPDEITAALKNADSGAESKKDNTPEPSIDNSVTKATKIPPGQLDFAYTFHGANVPWKPVLAFDDGSHVYIQMPESMKSTTAPALLIAGGGGTQMANYRVESNYYVVDRLFNNAILVSGVGRDQDRVTISYAGGQR
jgi:type IV secretion system protein VirB9